MAGVSGERRGQIYRINQLDGTSYGTDDKIILHFYPGEYEVDDFKIGAYSSTLNDYVPFKFEIRPYYLSSSSSSEGEKPVFRLRDNATIWMAGEEMNAFMYLLHTEGFKTYGRVFDSVFDCNGPGQSTYVNDDTGPDPGPKGRRKVGGISLKGMDLAVERCEVFAFLAKEGGRYGWRRGIPSDPYWLQ